MRLDARLALAWLTFAVLPAASSAQDFSFPGFAVRGVVTNGATIHVRFGGAGPAVVLLHGYGETGDMWAPLAADLARDHTVVVPDLRGLGLSSKPAGGFDKKNQAMMATVMRAAGDDVMDGIVPDSGHWIMEENPRATIKLVRDFLTPG
jgi:pimeloyl-ACP methyl ester carboxylesterase